MASSTGKNSLPVKRLMVLPFRLMLSSLPREELHSFAFHFIRLVQPLNSNHFLSYTETDTEISLVLDEDAASHIPQLAPPSFFLSPSLSCPRLPSVHSSSLILRSPLSSVCYTALDHDRHT